MELELARERLDSELWCLIFEFAIPDALAYCTCLSLVSKGFRSLVGSVWPRGLILLDLTRSRSEVPPQVWDQWADRKIQLRVVKMGGRSGWRAKRENLENVLARLRRMNMPVSSLDLQDSRVADTGLAQLVGLPVQFLLLSYCYDITDQGLSKLKSLPLQHLRLHFCRSITDDGLAHLAQLPLQHLDLDSCRRVTAKGLAHLTSLPLRHLSLYSCVNVKSNEALRSFAQLLTLRFLDLRFCPVAPISSAGETQLTELLPSGCQVRT
eukprot:gb/GEZN01012808.1/.p1 GENE.gb/GEZN01012808.1/~~gb/GEZN01012808.1/.p1  ORF type:complete len:266 (+),score=28.99 gb/GEZN01012808.1/:42-839(+)